MLTGLVLVLLLACLWGGYALGRVVGRVEEKGERRQIPPVSQAVARVGARPAGHEPVTVRCEDGDGRVVGTVTMGRRGVTTTLDGQRYMASYRGADGVWVYRLVGPA